MCNLLSLLQYMYIAMPVTSSEMGHHKTNSRHFCPHKSGLHVKLIKNLLNGRENNFQPVKKSAHNSLGDLKYLVNRVFYYSLTHVVL